MNVGTTTALEFNVGGVQLRRPFSVNRLGHVGLYQRDVEAAAVFYQDLLGFARTDERVNGDPPNKRIVFLTYGTDHHALVLLDARIGQERDARYANGVTVNQMSFQVGSLREVLDGHRYLSELGRTIWRVGRDVPGSNFAVYAEDPDGFPVELFYGMEQIGWQREAKPPGVAMPLREPPKLPARSEVDEIASFLTGGGSWEAKESEATRARFDVGGILMPRPFKVTGIGPLSLFVADVSASAAYYREVYGFSLTEEVVVAGRRAAYLRTGSEHHTLALVPIELRTEFEFPARSSLMSLGLRVGSYEQLNDAVAFLRSKGVEVQTDVHHELHPGIEELAYALDPDGHRVMLYCAIEQIGWDGKPRPALLRRTIRDDWPPQLDSSTDTFASRTFQGPIG